MTSPRIRRGVKPIKRIVIRNLESANDPRAKEIAALFEEDSKHDPASRPRRKGAEPGGAHGAKERDAARETTGRDRRRSGLRSKPCLRPSNTSPDANRAPCSS